MINCNPHYLANIELRTIIIVKYFQLIVIVYAKILLLSPNWYAVQIQVCILARIH